MFAGQRAHGWAGREAASEDEVVGRVPPARCDAAGLDAEPFVAAVGFVAYAVCDGGLGCCGSGGFLGFLAPEVGYYGDFGSGDLFDWTSCHETVPRVYCSSSSIVSFRLPESLRLAKTSYCEDGSVYFICRSILKITFDGSFKSTSI